jgi:hypothetical protein
MSELLYQRGAKFDAELWDDSELVAAWNRQVTGGDQRAALTAAQEAHAARAAADGDGDGSESDDSFEEEDDEEDEEVPAPAQKVRRTEGGPRAGGGMPAAGAQMPPLPQWADARTRQLLQVWFQAGYWQGVAAASAAETDAPAPSGGDPGPSASQPSS